jgi:carbonic anhydrase/acetyltransferase-like protein (isoleucine patch superfamily)
LRSRVILERIPHDPAWWRVPKQQAPQQLGWNICPLEFKQGKVFAVLDGYVDVKRGGNWRAGFVAVDAAGKPTYGKVFKPGEVAEFDVKANCKELYLTVCATPDRIMDIPMTGDFRSFEQEQFPYRVKLSNCQPLDVLLAERAVIKGRSHRNGGGLVESSAEVAATAYVGPDARVLGNSKVLGNARIEDFAVIRDATVMDEAVVGGHALVFEESIISDRAKVRDYAVVKGRTKVSGDAKILEHAVIFTEKNCSDLAVVKGVSAVYGGNQSGSPMIDGFYAKGNEITKGKWFTWSWGQGKNPGEVDANFGGLYADYDFEEPHGWMLRDAFGVTWGYLTGSPAFVPKDDGSAGTDRVLLLNGKDQFVELQKDLADMANCTYTAEVSWDGSAEGARIFEFAAENGDAVFLTPNAGGKMVFSIRKGGRVESVVAPPLKKNVWATVQVMIDGSHASLYLDGVKAGENLKMSLRPDQVRATRCSLGRGFQGNFFGGKIGRFTVHSVALVDSEPPTPNPAAFSLAPLFTSPGSLVMTAKTGSDPLGLVEYWFEEQGGSWNSGWTGESSVHLSGRDASRPLRYRLKMRDKGGNETRFSEPVLAGGFPEDAKVLIVDPRVPAVIEAEQTLASVPSGDGSATWEKFSDIQGFVGEGYLSIPDRGWVNEPFDATAARLDYALRFTQPGQYFLWIRGNGNNDGGTSIHAGFDLKLEEWGSKLRVGHGRYAWTRSPSFSIERPGSYLFSIWVDEDGAMVDRLIFTASQSYEPSPDQRADDQVMIGKGPSASLK